jgi:4-hydroxythreonine-4-phosphate dehydrogenase
MDNETGTPGDSGLRVGITVGDPAGVGPEIVAKAIAAFPADLGTPVVYGHREFLLPGEPSAPGPETVPEVDWSAIEIVEPEDVSEAVPPGASSAEGGRLSLAWVKRAVRDALKRRIDAIITGPVSKESWALAGSAYRGHTGLLQDLCGVPSSVMMLLNSRVRVALVTHHIPLRAVPDAITPALVGDTIRITASGLADMGIPSPRVAVAGLNPHAGEEGLLGREEDEIIRPAVRECADLGIAVSGPYPGDTVFHRAASGEFDAVVAMYHDQGLAPLKALSFADAVNVTLGLPIVRTSVGHGTAFDIAGRGVADPGSLLAAVSLAALMARHRRGRT